MKILYVSFLHPAIVPGGAQQVAYEMFQAAKDSGYESFFLAAIDSTVNLQLQKPGAIITGFEERENEFLFFPLGYNFTNFQINDERTLHFLSEFIQDVAPDIVHFHHYHVVSLDVVNIVRKVLPHCNIVMHLHEMLAICKKDGQMITTGKKLCYESSPVACHKCFINLNPDFFVVRKEIILSSFLKVDSFVVPTYFLKNRYVEWGLPHDKIHVIANGLKTQTSIMTSSAEVNRFGFFGQFVDNKGLSVIFDSILILIGKKISHQQIFIDINGANIRYASNENQIRYTDMKNSVENIRKAGINLSFLEDYDRRSLPLRMSRVDWVLVPSIWWETFALVVSEAWLFGRVPIVSDIGALQERVINGKNGVTFSVADPHDLAKTILDCSYNLDLHQILRAGVEQPISHVQMFKNHETSVYRK